MQAARSTAVFILIIAMLAVALPLVGSVAHAADETWQTHRPTRPLHAAVDRAMQQGPAYFVDAVRGSDENAGTQAAPFRTIAHAASQLQPGHTLYLRGGVYFEHVALRNIEGASDAPVTIRSYPGEVAVIDGGIPDFQQSPQTAWEPSPDGAPGEYRSTSTYADLGSGGDRDPAHLMGSFAESMIPLAGYRFIKDLRSSNEYWDEFDGPNSLEGDGIYGGPGVWYDRDTGRIHVRLAHTDQAALGDENYKGETDPRKLELVIAGAAMPPPLLIEQCGHLRLQDIVVRGAFRTTVQVDESWNVEFDHVTIYGGAHCLNIHDSAGIRAAHTAFRGLAAPWTYRHSLKYRSVESRLISATSWLPTGNDNRDFELAYCEFTDSVDGVFVGNVNRVRIHHSLLDNVSDDGFFLTANSGFDGVTPGGDVHIYQNLLRRCLTTLAFGTGHGWQIAREGGRQTGSGVRVMRNVFDMRRPVMYTQPSRGETTFNFRGRIASDHGSPTWEPMSIYHNTCIMNDERRVYGANSILATRQNNPRIVLNNIFTQLEKPPGTTLPDKPVNLQADYNLHWSFDETSEPTQALLRTMQARKEYENSKQAYPPGCSTHDVVANPQFAAFHADWRSPIDLSLAEGSPAKDAGVALPAALPDPLANDDSGAPDLGALPHGAQPWRVGVLGRLDVFGAEQPTAMATSENVYEHDWQDYAAAMKHRFAQRPAAIVSGYPAHDRHYAAYAMRRAGMRVDEFHRQWLDTDEYKRYGMIVIIGDLQRGGVEPRTFTESDLQNVSSFINSGGTLLLMLRGKDAFKSTHGAAWLQQHLGEGGRVGAGEALAVQQPGHALLSHAAFQSTPQWAARPPNAQQYALPAAAEHIVIGTDGAGILVDKQIGKGRLAYIGWTMFDHRPTRSSPFSEEALANDRAFLEQAGILMRIAADAAAK